jgi:hypothetical protein
MKRETAIVAADIAGRAALTYGCWLAWHPAGFIAPGAAGVRLVDDRRLAARPRRIRWRLILTST